MSTRLTRPDAILFDFDGVLIDSENIHVAAWERTLRRMGYELAPDRCARAAEIDDHAFLAELLAEHDIHDADLDGWVARKQQIAAPLFADGAAWAYPGVNALIETARQAGVRLGVVSTSWRINIETALRVLGISDAFELIIAKEDAPPKPDPAGYRLALERLQLAPEVCLAVEDSPVGLAAARAAGLRVLAVGHRRSARTGWFADAPFVPGFEPIEPAVIALGLNDSPGSSRHD
ncbi:MAG: haloacid dehalogenase [Isosphaeraceae bacterium]|nr:MAG: haloacid dehalogenase [Isosphaeraceae bacterium]